MTTAASRLCCPHLGLHSERTIMLMSPTMAHRCYVQPEPLLPDPERQRQFCLGANHTQCPLYAPSTTVSFENTPSATGKAEGGALLALAAAPTPSTQLVLVQQPPVRPNKANRILLPRRHPAPLVHTRARQPLLLPAVSSYSARQIHRWSFLSTKVTLAATLALIVFTLSSSLLIRQPATAEHSYQAGVVAQESIPALTATKPPLTAAVAIVQAAVNPSPTPTATPTSMTTLARFITPTPPAGGQVYALTPGNNSAGWWMSNDNRRNHINDAFLYVGQRRGETYIAALRFDLQQVVRGAELVHGELRLTGARADNFAATVPATWQIQFIAEEALPNPASADFLTIFSAPAAHTLSPAITASALAVGGANTWQFDATAKAWLQEQLLLGATAFTMRITANTNNQETLFAWESGHGTTSGHGPLLLLSTGPAPATPPRLPTKPFLVATPTRVPANVLTVVAVNATATAVAVTTGTYTPVPYQVVTPTPFPANLATVQAIALDRSLPPVLLHTATPANPALATGDAQYATAVAVTTGTFTPVPADFVTPVLIMPSPPAEDVATEAARAVEATTVAASGAATATALPYNAVIAQYIYATALPQNEATAAAQAVIATADALVNGTPTPLPWNAIVITAVPTPLPPLPTALPSLQPISDFTPTATPTVYLLPEVMPAIYRNKILFKTNRSGSEETYALDPNRGELFRVNESWVHMLAFQQLALSPDRSNTAVVMADASGILQIQTKALQYGTIRQLTAFKGISYDPAWSPQGDKIAFVSTDSGSDEIYLVSIDGAIVQQLTSNSNLWDKHPSWSPDGSQLVFYSNREGDRRQLWIMNADGSEQRNLSNNAYEDWDPIWVP